MIQLVKAGRIHATLKDAGGSVQLSKGDMLYKRRGIRLRSPFGFKKDLFKPFSFGKNGFFTKTSVKNGAA